MAAEPDQDGDEEEGQGKADSKADSGDDEKYGQDQRRHQDDDHVKSMRTSSEAQARPSGVGESPDRGRSRLRGRIG
ncbi:MAG: hypothetical protein C4306_06760 [Thermoleophilia bacterium]